MATVTVTYDQEVGAAYVTVRELPAVRTIELVPDRLMLDVGEDERPVGFEIIGLDVQSLRTLLHTVEEALSEIESETESDLLTLA